MDSSLMYQAQELSGAAAHHETEESGSDSDSSFEIMFEHGPEKFRKESESDSDDFIVFDHGDLDGTRDVPDDESDSEESDTDESDSDEDLDGGSGRLTHSATVNNLDDVEMEADGEDVVDCPFVGAGDVMLSMEVDDEADDEADDEDDGIISSGLLMNKAKKLMRKNLPPKKVTFSPHPPKVHIMRVWVFAARQARIGHWKDYALDRERFQRRIANTEEAVSWVLKSKHRSSIMSKRFIPWWRSQEVQETDESKMESDETGYDTVDGIAHVGDYTTRVSATDV